MDATLHQLGEILLRGVPTFFLVIALFVYLKYMFFGPLEKVLRARYDATEGARKLAEESLQRATARTAEYEAAMRAARGEIYQEQERLRRQLQQERAAAVEAARRKSEAQIAQAKTELAAEAAQARNSLAAESESLASHIADSVLRRRVA
jgi:F-type H+-transporting ATPase subunit b